MRHYRFGAVTVDAGVALPGLDHRRVPEAAHGSVHFCVHATRAAPPAGDIVLSGGRLRNLEIRATAAGGWTFRANGVVAWSVGPDRTTVAFHARDACLTPDDTDFLLTTVIPRTLNTHGYLVVHGAGIATGGGAMVVCGPSGSGKSTLAAAYAASRNVVLLGDDSIVLDVQQESGVTAWACDPDIRLCADTGGLASPTPIPLARYGTRAKARHPMPATATTASALPLYAVVRLVRAQAVTLRPLRPAPGVMALRDNLLRIDRTDPNSRAIELRKLALLTERVPVLELGSSRTGYKLDAEIGLLEALADQPRSAIGGF